MYALFNDLRAACFACATALIAAMLVAGSVLADDRPKTTADVEALVTELSNWGRWGKDDQLGALNLITPEKRKQAAMLVRWPGHTPVGVKNDTTVVTDVDLLPTFCAAAGVTTPADANGDGENLIAAFNGETVVRKRPIFWLHKGKAAEPDWWPRLAVRDGDWKLLMTYDAGPVELHDLKSDRVEDVGRDKAKEHPEIVARLSKLALDWHATLPTKADPTCVSHANQSDLEQRGERVGQAGKPAKKASTNRNKPFNRWDTDKDGFLTLEEYKIGPKGGENLAVRFQKFDTNGDGKLTREEFVGLSKK